MKPRRPLIPDEAPCICGSGDMFRRCCKEQYRRSDPFTGRSGRFAFLAAVLAVLIGGLASSYFGGRVGLAIAGGILLVSGIVHAFRNPSPRKPAKEARSLLRALGVGGRADDGSAGVCMDEDRGARGVRRRRPTYAATVTLLALVIAVVFTERHGLDVGLAVTGGFIIAACVLKAIWKRPPAERDGEER